MNALYTTLIIAFYHPYCHHNGTAAAIAINSMKTPRTIMVTNIPMLTDILLRVFHLCYLLPLDLP